MCISMCMTCQSALYMEMWITMGKCKCTSFQYYYYCSIPENLFGFLRLNCTLYNIPCFCIIAGASLVPKFETWGFDSWLTSSLRIECNFPLASSDVQMMSKTKFCFYAINEQNKWARSSENMSYAICEQQRRRSACASAQSDQRLCYSLLG